MKSDNPRLLFTLFNTEFFETLDNYTPTQELIEPVRAMCGEGWALTARGFWCHCNPGVPLDIQGWKIHISGTPMTAQSLLSRIVPICAAEHTPFKFCSDLRMVRFSMSKSCARITGGKFITIYPSDEAAFLSMLDRCYKTTRGFIGPYLLTDYPYRDSNVVFFRYGEHAGLGGLDAGGRPLRAILSPTGAVELDKREPLAPIPEWVPNSLGAKRGRPTTPNEMWLREMRYRITGARRYSNFGGIYKGEDTLTGQKVVIREARPHLGDPTDAREPQNLLRKQARIMKKLGPAGLAPTLIELFEQEGHLFLVEEMLQGDNLWGHAMGFGHFVPVVDSANLDTVIYRTARMLVYGLLEVHNLQIVLRDLTKSNVFVTNQGQLKFFDFEFSFELDREDPPLQGGTEGYVSPEQRITAWPTFAEDYYALGALLLDIISFTATGLFLNRPGILMALRQNLRDLGLPSCYADAVAGLTAPNAEDRLHPLSALRLIENGPRSWGLGEQNGRFVAVSDPVAPLEDRDHYLPEREPPSAEVKERIRTTVNGITSYIRRTLRPLDADALWPASPEMFATNPVSLSFGASGIVCYLNRVGENIPLGIPQWIADRTVPRTCTPALYIGMSGVAWCLLQIGCLEEAEAVLLKSNDHKRIMEIPGLYHGAAGWALTNLIFWHNTGQRLYLDNAVEIGLDLIRSAKRSSQGMYWESNGEIPFGLAFGASGIGLFLAYLYIASGESRFVEAAEAALDFEIANARWSFRRIVWPELKTASTEVSLMPHTRFGTAGVGTAAVRLYAITKEPRFRRLAEQCAFTASLRLGNKLWQDWGLAGLGEFMLDMFYYLSDDAYLNTAYYLAEAILPHELRKEEGVAFAGAELLRISCDFGMGSAGIGWFLHRLLNPTMSRLLFPHELHTAHGA